MFAKAEFTKLDDIDNIVNNMDKIDISKIETKDFDKIAKSLGKDISTLNTVDEINQKIQDAKDALDQTKSTTDVLKDLTADQKKVYKRVEEDITKLTEANTALKKTPGYVAGNATEISNNSKILKMKEWQLKIKKFDVSELDAFATLRKLEFKTNHIVEIFELKKIDAIGDEIKKLEKGNNDLSGLLKELEAQKKAGTEISETLIKSLDDMHLRSLAKNADEIAEFTKDLFKILAKIT